METIHFGTDPVCVGIRKISQHMFNGIFSKFLGILSSCTYRIHYLNWFDLKVILWRFGSKFKILKLIQTGFFVRYLKIRSVNEFLKFSMDDFFWHIHERITFWWFLIYFMVMLGHFGSKSLYWSRLPCLYKISKIISETYFLFFCFCYYTKLNISYRKA